MKIKQCVSNLFYWSLECFLKLSLRIQCVPYMKQDGCLLYVGEVVMVRSNEPEPLVKGVLCELFDNNGKWSSPIPIVRFDDGAEKMVMGIILPYQKRLFDHINLFKPIEQWNLLAGSHAQIREKYGVSYRTKAQIQADIDRVSAEIENL